MSCLPVRPDPTASRLLAGYTKDPELQKIPVIILSGVRKVLDLPFRLEPDDEWMPVKAFLEKPVKPDKLLSEIQKALGK